MTRRAIGWLVVVVGGMAALPAPAAAHRLDEYLQATRLNIEADRIGVEIDLTPGASIAAQIAEQVDSNRDGRFSTDEQRRYAQSVIASMTLMLDGHVRPVVLTTEDFPTPDAMAAGTGTIRLHAVGHATAASGRHHLQYRAAPLTASSVYLVNALMPADARIQLAAPQRDRTQRELVLDFSVAPDEALLRTAWVAIAFALFSTLLALRYARWHGHYSSRARRALSNA